MAALAAFVLGVCLLQLQAVLPGIALLVGSLPLGGAVAAWCARAPQRDVARVAAVAAAFLIGFSYAGLRAQARLAEQLPFADEGRDVGVTGVIATLPARGEHGVRFERELRADWLMVPHHGSRLSSMPALLAAVRPTVALAPAGYRNRFGHPNAQVLARYAALGIPVVRTDYAGAAQWRFEPDGRAVFRPWRSIAVRYWHNRPGAGQVDAAAADDESIEVGPPGQPFFGMP